MWPICLFNDIHFLVSGANEYGKKKKKKKKSLWTKFHNTELKICDKHLLKLNLNDNSKCICYLERSIWFLFKAEQLHFIIENSIWKKWWKVKSMGLTKILTTIQTGHFGIQYLLFDKFTDFCHWWITKGHEYWGVVCVYMYTHTNKHTHI